MPGILFITHTPPWPTTSGGQQRTSLLLRALRRCGAVDWLLIPRSPGGFTPELLDRLKSEFALTAYISPRPRGSYWPWSLVRPLAPIFVDMQARRLGQVAVDYSPDPIVSQWLSRRLSRQRYDLIVGRYLQPTVCSGALGYRPVLLDVDDLDTDRCRTQLQEHTRFAPHAWRIARRLRQLEQVVPRCLDRVDRMWVCSDADRMEIGQEKTTVLSNIPYWNGDTMPIAPSPSLRTGCRILMVGSLSYAVNERGIDRFLRRAWPVIHKKHPAATFRIVGSGMSERQRVRWSRIRGVEPVGFVENLAEEYAACAFTVTPLFEGGGTKIKVLESLAYARTCVVSQHAQRGFTSVLRHAESLWVGDDDIDLVRGCITLLADASLRNNMAESGHRLVKEHFTFDSFSRIVAGTVREVLADNQDGVVRRS